MSWKKRNKGRITLAIVTKVDDYFLRAKVQLPYPSVVIESKNIEALPVVLSALEPGPVSVIFEYGGKFYVAKEKISCSAITLHTLLRVYKFTIIKSPGERYHIDTPTDILEVGEWNIS